MLYYQKLLNNKYFFSEKHKKDMNIIKEENYIKHEDLDISLAKITKSLN